MTTCYVCPTCGGKGTTLGPGGPRQPPVRGVRRDGIGAATMTQATRLLTYLRANPGASSLDIVRDLLIINTTGRISDLRAAGHIIDARRDGSGAFMVFRYYVREAPVQQALAL